ncbi:MAG: hypothetical protein ACJAT1_001020 [Marivirga sp.]|jgi:hypothetical protein
MKNLKKSTLLAMGVFVMFSAFTFIDLSSKLIRWESKTHDFGTIEKDEPVNQTFYFVNDSESSISIIKTKTSCGCTVSEHSQGEILSGQRGFVKAEYNAAKSGVFSKTVSVYTSLGDKPILLKIKGEVR